MNRLYFFSFLVIMLSACGQKGDEPVINFPTHDNYDANNMYIHDEAPATEIDFATGADVSWLSQQEAEGIKFFYDDGRQGDCMEILKGVGVDSYRFRVWVNPANKWCGIEDVIVKCKRASDLGARIMIDFHYSDSWADPSKQTIPAAWKNLDKDQLIEKVKSYTAEMCSKLKNAGITPTWVQVGNETGNGMLWPIGKADTNPQNYALLTTAGYEGVKSVFPETKVIVHLQNGQKTNDCLWLLDLLNKYSAKFDVCGFSLYPEKENYTTFVRAASNTMTQCIEKYNKDVMLCEVGMGEAYTSECRAFLNECINLLSTLPENRYLGVFYWEPQAYNDWQGYKKGAFNNNGAPTEALKAFTDENASVEIVKE